LPKVLSHADIERLFAEIERRVAAELPFARRLAALVELLYGSGSGPPSWSRCRATLCRGSGRS
jgi:site-specific recombinase XerD